MIKLIRYGSTPQGTFGELHVDNHHSFYTVEKPWRNNEPFNSCVPSGDYILDPHKSSRYGQVLALINKEAGVYHWDEPGAKRYAILIHPANYAHDVLGCIGLGEALSGHGGHWMITKSKRSVDNFYLKVSPKEVHSLHIEWRQYE